MSPHYPCVFLPDVSLRCIGTPLVKTVKFRQRSKGAYTVGYAVLHAPYPAHCPADVCSIPRAKATTRTLLRVMPYTTAHVLSFYSVAVPGRNSEMENQGNSPGFAGKS